ncbi:MAG: hypothetical protein FD126_2505 [Elusimicrobia bacterium]|nr:MAG: hypothetical protein FD126_2505 [Elusimicrobiota bacterium]
MKAQHMEESGGVWRTLREALGALVASPLGCLALGTALLGVGGIIHETEGMRKAETARSSWANVEAQDIRDAVRDESAVRTFKAGKSSKPSAKDRERALRSQVGHALAAAFSGPQSPKR